MRFVRRVVFANSIVRFALNPPAACTWSRKINPSVTTAVRTFSINRVDFKRVVTYEEVKQAIKSESFLIDVREAHEITVTGKIPFSTNIPMGQLQTALVLSNEDFQKTYNRKKPDLRHELIFYCRSGCRAVAANELAHKLGYFRSKAYVGSWEDWEKRSKKEKSSDENA